MKKAVKIMSVFMSAMLSVSTLSLIPTTASALESSDNSQVITSGDYKYILNDGNATITGYTGDSAEITLPGFIDGYKVASVGDYAFSGNQKLETITLPITLTSLGSSAFAESNALKTVNFSDNLKKIGVSAFYGCKSLTSIKIPNGVSEIQEYTFAECDNLGEVTLPKTVESIGANAFEKCPNLYKVHLPYSSVSIGDDAFSECTSLKSINLEGVTSVGISSFYACQSLYNADLSSCTSFGDYAFFDCETLKNIDFSDEIYSIPQNAFEYTAWTMYAPDGILYAGSLAYEIIGDYTDKSISFKNGTTAINDDFLTYNESIESISLPEGLVSVGVSAFEGCSKLKKVTIPDLCTVQAMAFYDCSSLTEINYNEGMVWRTAPSAFENTAWFNSQPDGIVYHGTAACGYKGDFNSTEKVKDGTTVIVDGLFYADEELTSIDIPDSVEYIGSMAFEECVNLKNVKLPESLYTLSAETFLGCESLESVVLPEVVNIGESAFAHCTSLKSIIIPESVCTSIDDCAFLNCTSLENVTIKGDIQAIGSAVFMNCENLKSINIPESVTSIGNDVFEFCENITIYCYENSYAHEYAKSNSINYSLITDGRQLGDVNNDGKVDVNDVTQLQKHLAGFTADDGQPLLSEAEIIYADMTKDGIIDSRDVTALQIYLSEQ